MQNQTNENTHDGLNFTDSGIDINDYNQKMAEYNLKFAIVLTGKHSACASLPDATTHWSPILCNNHHGLR